MLKSPNSRLGLSSKSLRTEPTSWSFSSSLLSRRASKCSQLLRKPLPEFRKSTPSSASLRSMPAMKPTPSSSKNARFSDYPYCFLATSEGVERVPDHLDANGLFKAVADKFEPVSYDDVVTITSAEEFEKLSGPRMIKYFEQWCGHCKAAKKPYAKAATQLKGQAILAEIECSLNDETKAICQENDVQGYPTIKFVDAEDEEVDFQGPRTVGGFSEFVLARVSKPAAAAAPEAEVASAEHEHDEL
eukprot:TRINITY_DN664_c0_g1_i2.p1 TRINITY_DN664_c0_g1~~TRINITY_DN664_c0_g1_i2.p1  ORF type:complete len:245 (+),score=83.01 TRINITY_DN664_c0_g1_i2:116-850(+)